MGLVFGDKLGADRVATSHLADFSLPVWHAPTTCEALAKEATKERRLPDRRSLAARSLHRAFRN